jgi:hypothetical protein
VQLPEVPVTVYEVLAEGLTVIDGPLASVLQLYEEPPFAVKVAEPPAQIVAELTVITAAGATVTMLVAVSLQPRLVPVTV